MGIPLAGDSDWRLWLEALAGLLLEAVSWEGASETVIRGASAGPTCGARRNYVKTVRTPTAESCLGKYGIPEFQEVSDQH